MNLFLWVVILADVRISPPIAVLGCRSVAGGAIITVSSCEKRVSKTKT